MKERLQKILSARGVASRRKAEEMIQDGLNAKLVQLPEDVRTKFRGTLSRIVNEGASGLICLIL